MRKMGKIFDIPWCVSAIGAIGLRMIGRQNQASIRMRRLRCNGSVENISVASHIRAHPHSQS